MYTYFIHVYVHVHVHVHAKDLILLPFTVTHTDHDSFSLEDTLKHLQHSQFGLQRGGVVKDLVKTNNELFLKTFDRRTKMKEVLFKGTVSFKTEQILWQT